MLEPGVPSAMFAGPARAVQGCGVFAGPGVGATMTKPSSTLFVTRLPRDFKVKKLKALFKACDGYVGLRQVRALVFVDFESAKTATRAMRKHQGAKLPSCGGGSKGIAIDFDKDDVAKRNKNYERQKQEREREEALAAKRASQRPIFCSACGTVVFSVHLACKALAAVKRRGTDNAWALNEAKLLRDFRLCRGETKLIRREKGVERQHRFNCANCEIFVAYRPKPRSEPSKFLYIVPGGVVMHRSAVGTHGSAAAVEEEVAPAVNAAGNGAAQRSGSGSGSSGAREAGAAADAAPVPKRQRLLTRK